MEQVPLPIIDMGPLRRDEPGARAALARQISAASRELGFFYVINHGVPDALMRDQLRWAESFFSQPLAQKMKVDFRNLPVRRGYEPMAMQTLQAGAQPDQKEGFSINRDPSGDPDRAAYEGPNQWPANATGFEAGGFRAQMEAYRDAMIVLGTELCGLLALSLGLDADYFADAMADPNVCVRLLHYPPQPANIPADRFGCGAHTDWGLITILLQDDCGGLEIEVGADQWLRAKPVPGAFIVNLGDMVVRMTAGRYASNVHRVINRAPQRHRYSVPTFFNPPGYYMVDRVPTCAGEGKPPPIRFNDYIEEMAKRTYALNLNP